MPSWGCSLAWFKAVACRAKDRGFKSHHPRVAVNEEEHSTQNSF
jgi:hypothetical protein